MINVDISNIWGELALQDLLMIEQEIFTAHSAVAEVADRILLPEETVPDRIRQTADRIRSDSEFLVVLGTHGSLRGIRGILELLQGPDRNLAADSPRILFAGNSLSTRQWKQLRKTLEGRDFSLLVMSGPGSGWESLLALRDLKWTLDRKYGTDESRRRIIAAASAEDERLNRMAQVHGWECFEIPSAAYGSCGVLSGAGLLILETAGLDAGELYRGAARARKELDLRSFENPVWLYAAVRNLMLRSGKKLELVGTWEPGFDTLAAWWRQLFLEGEGRGLIPVGVLYPAGTDSLRRMLDCGREDVMETMVRFAPGEDFCMITLDANDLDGLNTLSDRMLGDVEEQVYLQVQENQADRGIGMVTLECGALTEQTLGELVYFLELSCAVSAATLGVSFCESMPEPQGEDMQPQEKI